MKASLYNGDCLEVMRQIPDKSVDLVVTDPPYGIKYQSNQRTRTEKFDLLKNDDNDIRFDAYSEFARILKDDSVCIIFASWKNVAFDFIELKKHFDIKNMIIWYKPGGGMGDLKHTLLTDYEIAIVCHKGKATIRGKREGCVWECAKVNPNKMVHPTEKPISLFERLICKWSDENDIILDPFMGSGTAGVACVNTNRKFIGVELDERYFKIAQDRINKVKSEWLDNLLRGVE